MSLHRRAMNIKSMQFFQAKISLKLSSKKKSSNPIIKLPYQFTLTCHDVRNTIISLQSSHQNCPNQLLSCVDIIQIDSINHDEIGNLQQKREIPNELSKVGAILRRKKRLARLLC